MSARNKILAHCMSNIYQWISGQQQTQHPDANIIFKPIVLRDLETISEIFDDCLYLSGSAPLTAEKLTSMGITGVVCALTELEEKRVLPSTYFNLILRAVYVRLPDSEGSEISRYLDPVTEFMHDEIRKGGKVLVHCVAGMSRSASFVIAYLMRYKNLNLPQAYDHVAKRRKIIQPNESFLYQLARYESLLKSAKSSEYSPRDLLKIEEEESPPEQIQLSFINEKPVSADV